VPDADGVERSGAGYDIANHAGTGAYTASRVSGERRTADDRADDTRPGIRQRAA